MNDNDNIKELIGARLEEIHLSETMTDTMPSDEEILRWETLAQARRAQKQRKKRRLLSMAAVFLLAVVISVAVIVSPPDAEAGGDGRVLIVDSNKGLTVIEYGDIANVPRNISNKFVLIPNEKYALKVDNIVYTNTNNVEQLEIVYTSQELGKVEITEIISQDFAFLESFTNSGNKREKWGDKEVYVIEDNDNTHEKTFVFISNNIYVSVYVEKNKIPLVRKIIKETF